MPSNQTEDMAGQEINNHVVNLSNHCLKKIECMPKGISPHTLLLTDNEISEVENLQHFAHLQQLSLAGNHIDNMKGISAAQGLRVLDLSNNSISCIEGVSPLRNLEWLNLSGNNIEDVENLDRNTNLYHLDLSDNSIAFISGLKSLKKLKTLLLHGNLISSLAVVKDQLSSTVCTISLADNEISDLNEMMHLSHLTNLEQLSLVNNPCVLSNSSWRLEINYRPYLVYCCPNLTNLDGRLVTKQERAVTRVLNQAFHEIGHPSPGQHIQLVSILHHVCTEPTAITQKTPDDASDDPDGDTLLESESLYVPVPPSDMEPTQSSHDDPIMTEEEALRLLSLAATIIQTRVRGYLVRKKFDFCQYRRKKYAAARIQAAWRGYHARTTDIRVVNVRNELRVRRLISVCHNLYNRLEREHEQAVKSRDQFKTAIKYLWCQITEQKRIHQQQLHKEQVKAAITIQAWWRGCISRKIFPRVYKRLDQVSTLFAFCRSLQKQLDEFKSEISEIAQGGKRNEDFKKEGWTRFERQGLGTFPDVAEEVTPVGDSVVRLLKAVEDDSYVPFGAQSRDVHREMDVSSGEETKLESNMVGQIASEKDSPEHEQNTIIPSVADQMIQEMYKVALTNVDHIDPASSKPSPSPRSHDIQEVNVIGRVVSHPGTSDQFENGEDPSPSGSVDLDVNKVAEAESDQNGLQEESSAISSSHQQDPSLEYKRSVYSSDKKVGELAEKMASFEPPITSVEESVFSDLAEDLQKEKNATEDLFRVGIPEIIVSYPVPSDDESNDGIPVATGGESNDGSPVERSTKWSVGEDEVQEQPSVKDQNITADTQLNRDLSQESPTFNREEMESRETAADSSSFSIESKQSGVSESSLENYFALTEASSGKQGDDGTAAQSSRNVPNLGERASNLLSQLRSEIASMKSARLSSISPAIASEDDVNGAKVGDNMCHVGDKAYTVKTSLTSQARDPSLLELQECDSVEQTLQEHGTSGQASTKCDIPETSSQERDVCHAASQERDTCRSEPVLQENEVLQGRDPSQPGPVSAVTYRLPLFEDVDSTCTSLSLDDFDLNSEEGSNLPFDTGHTFDEKEG